ncbi:energy-coupling factor transporter transmembrane component T family protein [Floccifex sp.]|uniref:energy-coupling factor transporter transmembrane component T family protein n=1 Tax=Floccifex sp. TaxID=2815810 RepID=UPI003F12591E
MKLIDNWNPSIKMISIFICVFILAFQYNIQLNLFVFCTSILSLIFFSNAKIKTIIKLLIPASIAAFGLFMMGMLHAKGNDITQIQDTTLPFILQMAMNQNIQTGLQLATRLLAFAGLGILFSLSTDGNTFIQSLIHQCHLSPVYAYGILAAFHLFPDMAKEYHNVKLAYEIKGLHPHALSFNVLFTMLVNSIRWSESVAMAMESKGFSGKEKRTYHSIPKVTLLDIVLSICMISSMFLFF